jgi:hypothetical protein
MKYSPSLEADSNSCGQEIPRFLWKPKVYRHIHKTPQLFPLLSHSMLIPHFFKLRFNIILSSAHVLRKCLRYAKPIHGFCRVEN